jgi:hypothetical protein
VAFLVATRDYLASTTCDVGGKNEPQAYSKLFSPTFFEWKTVGVIKKY